MYEIVILPIIIFLARICDVSIGTVRIIFVAKGYKGRSALLGFIEVLLWIVVIAQIMQTANNLISYIAYAGGFAMGNYFGMLIEEKLSIGNVIVRIISTQNTSPLISSLKENNFRLTFLSGSGSYGEVKILFTVVKRKKLKKLINIIKEFNPKAFYSIEDIRYMNEPDSFARPFMPRYRFSNIAGFFRKRK
jgi:uncharacterized protein YebE (UPF0316 family)